LNDSSNEDEQLEIRWKRASITGEFGFVGPNGLTGIYNLGRTISNPYWPLLMQRTGIFWTPTLRKRSSKVS
ncbi:hypothetical protein MKW98_028516, partial [Papaver atlanticum]